MASLSTPTSFLPYHEPGIVKILIQTSLLLALNIVNTIFDRLIFCGLLGQVFIGVAWGTPGAKWLSVETEHVIVQLGYLGLILLVYEGGLETNFRSLKANIFLSVAVAATGIGFPMALSFTLQSLSNATPLQAFAAGAALCSTSLGTTFTVLSTSGLSSTRLGTVLSSAAMMDDVVGLVMVQVISNLGESAGGFKATTVVRPLAVSVGLAIAVPLLCRFGALPLTRLLNGMRISKTGGVVDRVCRGMHTAFVLHTLILLGLVTGATYAGTSNLFAAYLAGASISWWDILHRPSRSQTTPSLQTHQLNPQHEIKQPEGHDPTTLTGTEVFHTYYKTALQRILKPFFFASIGFAIPITDMFKGPVIWRGIVYTILMLFAKLITGVWLVRLDISWPRVHAAKGSSKGGSKGKSKSVPATTTTAQEGIDLSQQPALQETSTGLPPTSETNSPAKFSVPAPTPKINKPLSLYPAAMLGTAMTARGEIGFLIASLAETTGLFSPSGEPSSESSEIYLVVTWAIVLCTVIGPLGIGTLVKRVQRLQEERRAGKSDRSDPLGIWGVS
ncbi:Sodium/hydrogen exchanger family-domain-containing protein [Leptodontidium sp. 2 PMI_412]|nr:Sodium/hydrogen exchanger family-domain-containing protein [Leptodontidium sp. 2 PMI_412]